MDQLENHRCAA